MKQEVNQTEIEYIDLPSGERLILNLNYWNGSKFVDARIWYKSSKQESGRVWKPSRKGFRVSTGNFKKFAKAFARAAEIVYDGN